jgi:rRNA maturation protein Nop10
MNHEKCPKCNGPTVTAHPPSFSIDDPFAVFKIKAILESGLIFRK